MKKIALMFAGAVALAAPALVASATPAAAIDYPYCLSYVLGWSGMVEQCDYASMDQCRMSARGLNGSCAANWRYAYAQPPERPIRRRYRQPAY